MSTRMLTPGQEAVFILLFLAIGALVLAWGPTWVGATILAVCALLIIDGYFLRRRMQKPRQ